VERRYRRHRIAVISVGDHPRSLVRRSVRRNDEQLVESELMSHGATDFEMAAMDRVKGAAVDSDAPLAHRSATTTSPALRIASTRLPSAVTSSFNPWPVTAEMAN